MVQIRVTRIIKNPLNWIGRSQEYTNEFVALKKKKKVSFINSPEVKEVMLTF